MAKKFLGMPYPVCQHARGLLHTQFGAEQIKSDLLSLLLTNPGERVMLPNYGVNLRQFLFEPNDAALQSQVRNLIIAQLNIWEPRVVIEQIDITTQPARSDLHPEDRLEDQGTILLISILFFDPENIDTVEELKLEVPIP